MRGLNMVVTPKDLKKEAIKRFILDIEKIIDQELKSKYRIEKEGLSSEKIIPTKIQIRIALCFQPPEQYSRQVYQSIASMYKAAGWRVEIKRKDDVYFIFRE